MNVNSNEVLSDTMIESVLSTFPLGHPVVSIVLGQAHKVQHYVYDLGLANRVVDILNELPDTPARTGDCAELLDDTTEPVRSLSHGVVDLMAALKASLAATAPREPES